MKRILTYGTFDLLHYGHIRLLQRAKALGDYLIVAVSTDEFKFAAVHGVIFKGVSGKGFSSQKPLAKAESEKQHSDFYQAFFDNGDFTSYANVITPNSERVKMSNKEYKISAVVSVSKDELRRALETAGMIRNLNSGF